MHEQAIAQSIIRQASVHGKVLSLHVECGQLAPLPAVEVEKALKSFASFDVKVSEIPALVACECGYKGKPDVVLHTHDALAYFCPGCGKIPKILKGTEIVLANVTVE